MKYSSVQLRPIVNDDFRKKQNFETICHRNSRNECRLVQTRICCVPPWKLLIFCSLSRKSLSPYLKSCPRLLLKLFMTMSWKCPALFHFWLTFP
ncbi:hypothetical protein COOONC_10169 [Cooperia oncophora]